MTENTFISPTREPTAVLARAWRQIDAQLTTIFLSASVAIAAVVLFASFDEGWWHHDDGSLAHSAQRVLVGELPHRDFAELYTGTLSFLNAGIFAVAGEDLVNLRYPMFVLFLGFVVAYYLIALRIVSRWLAFAATVFAIAWTVPVYPAPMPSWYLLFLSTIGLYGVIRFMEEGRRRWLLLAGACGGVAVTIKIVAFWYVVAVILALLAAPTIAASQEAHAENRSKRHGWFVASAAGAALLLVALMISARLSAGAFAGLVIPLTAVCCVIALLGWRSPQASKIASRSSLKAVGVFIAAAAAPVVVFALPYIATRSVSDLIEGALITPRSRLSYAARDMPNPATLAWAAPIVALFYLRARASTRARQLIGVVAVTVIAFFVVTATTQPSYSILWETTRGLAPVLIVVSAFAINRRSGAQSADPGVTALIILVGAFTALLQFPFSAPLYFCYVVPVVLLAGLAGLQRLGVLSGALPVVILMALAVFGFRQLDQQPIANLGSHFRSDTQTAVLRTGRASVRVEPVVAEEYGRIRELVLEHRAGSDVIFAGPDAPEIYFLTESRNVTPAILDFLDVTGTTRGDELIGLLERGGIPVVVLNHAPQQSPVLDRVAISRIRELYRSAERVGHFEVRW